MAGDRSDRSVGSGDGTAGDDAAAGVASDGGSAVSSARVPLSAYPPDKLITTEHLAALWEINPVTLWRWRRAGIGPAFVDLSKGGGRPGRVGGRGPEVRYQVSVLREFLARHQIATDGKLPVRTPAGGAVAGGRPGGGDTELARRRQEELARVKDVQRRRQQAAKQDRPARRRR